MPPKPASPALVISLSVIGAVLVLAVVGVVLFCRAMPQCYFSTKSLVKLHDAPGSFLYFPFKSGRMGNALIQYCNLRLLAESSGKSWNMIPRVPFFPKLQSRGQSELPAMLSEPQWDKIRPTYRTNQKLTFDLISQYADRCRAWLLPHVLPASGEGVGPQLEWALHLRMGDVWKGLCEMNPWGHTPIPAKVYCRLLPRSARRAIVVSDMAPEHPVMLQFLETLRSTHPTTKITAQRKSVLEDFSTLVHARNLIGSFSTFSTVACFLRGGEGGPGDGSTIQPCDQRYISSELVSGLECELVHFEPPIAPFCHRTKGVHSFFQQDVEQIVPGPAAPPPPST